jgi:hypothetical protein
MATSLNSSCTLSCEVSDDGVTFDSALGSGTMNLSITNLGTYNNTTVYQTAIAGMTNVVFDDGNSDVGEFLLRASLTKASPGQHTVVKTGTSCSAASYFDVSFELQDDASGTWFASDRRIRILLSEPACGVAGQGVYIKRNGKTNILSWASSSYMLQGSTNLTSPLWVNLGTNSPVSLGPTNGLHFFRSVCLE